MKKMIFRRTLIQSVSGFVTFLVLMAGMNSCKKDNPAPNGVVPPIGPIAGTPDQRDSIKDLAKFFYLWNNNIPTSFNARSYPLYIAAADSSPVLEAIKLYSPLNPVNNLHFDHFSFLITEARYQSQFVTGVTKQFGMGFTRDRNNIVRISYVARASPAYSQGVRRGFQVNSINGIALNPIATQADLTNLNNVLSNSSSATFNFTSTTGGQAFNLTINQGTFGDDEVTATRVVKTGAKTIGYISYNTFLTQFDTIKGASHLGLDTAFAAFAAKGVTDLIVDLRYNGGGYVSVAEQMTNAMLPLASNGQVMYKQTYNDSLNYYHKYYKNGNNQIAHDTTVYINKKDIRNPSSLLLNNVVFVVSSNTASASELVINDLKPYFSNLKIIGLGKSAGPKKQNSAGKPFGYAYNFGLPNKKPHTYELFLINFESKNALGKDDYVAGFIPDFQTYDGVEYNWGDSNEDGFRAAYSYLTTSAFATASQNNTLAVGGLRSSSAGVLFSGSNFFGQERFSGMISLQKPGYGVDRQTLQIQRARQEISALKVKKSTIQ